MDLLLNQWVAVTSGVWAWHVRGTWGGATATLQWSPDRGATVLSLEVDPMTQNGLQIVAIPTGSVRVLITNGAGVSLVSDLRGV